MTAVAEAPSAPATSTATAPAASAPAPAAESVAAAPSNPLSQAIESPTNASATEAALEAVTESAKPTVETGSVVDGEGDADPSSAADEPDNDAVIDAVQSLIARGVTRDEIAKVKDRGALMLLARLTGDQSETAKAAEPAAAAAPATPAVDFTAASKAFAGLLGLSDSELPAINNFAQAIAAPMLQQQQAMRDAFREVIQFVEKREIDRASAPLAERYPKLKTPEGRKQLSDALAKMNGKKFADYESFVSAAADAAFAADWAVQQRAEQAKTNAAKARSKAVVQEAAPKTYSEDELATIRADLILAGKSQDQVRQHIERITGRKG